jgi:transposase
MNPQLCFLGVDVSKDTLDAHVRPAGHRLRVNNDTDGIAALVVRVLEWAPALVVLEATGGRELPLVAALAAASVPVAVVNPRPVRDFATATGPRAKTDALDAAVLAHFAEAIRPRRIRCPTPRRVNWRNSWGADANGSRPERPRASAWVRSPARGCAGASSTT